MIHIFHKWAWYGEPSDHEDEFVCLKCGKSYIVDRNYWEHYDD